MTTIDIITMTAYSRPGIAHLNEQFLIELTIAGLILAGMSECHRINATIHGYELKQF